MNDIFKKRASFIERLACVLAYYSPPPLNKYLYLFAGVKFKCVKKTWVGVRVSIDNLYPSLVTIDENVTIAFDSKLIVHFEPPEILADFGVHQRVSSLNIGAGSFLGAGSIILPGVVIGNNSIVGAGAVVTKNTPPNTVVAGNPARIIKKIDNHAKSIR